MPPVAGEQHRPVVIQRAIMPSVSDPSDLSARDVLARYPALRDDHLRYEKWGLVRPAGKSGVARSATSRTLP